VIRWSRPGRAGLAGALAVGSAFVALSALDSLPAAAASSPPCSSGQPTLTVQGTGLSTGTPDLLTVTADVHVVGSSAAAALNADNLVADAVQSALTKGGIAAKNIQTTGLSVQPNYNYPNGTAVLSGYAVDNSVVVKITKSQFSSAGTLIDDVVNAGGNAVQLQSLAFSIADQRNLEDQARTDAVHQAVSHARSMAAAAGEALGEVCSLRDTTPVNQPELVPGSPIELNAATAASSVPVPLQSGTQQANAQVTIVYALHNAPPRRRAHHHKS
jgi:uncharacterized protein YggE